MVIHKGVLINTAIDIAARDVIANLACERQPRYGLQNFGLHDILRVENPTEASGRGHQC